MVQGFLSQRRALQELLLLTLSQRYVAWWLHDKGTARSQNRSEVFLPTACSNLPVGLSSQNTWPITVKIPFQRWSGKGLWREAQVHLADLPQ